MTMDKIIYEAVLENKKNRENFKMGGLSNAYSKTDWMREFCTIHLNIGRNTGKTRHITENAKEGDLVVCREGTRLLIVDKAKERLSFYVPHISKHVYGKIFAECQIIFVDEPKQTLKPFVDIFEFYSKFMVNFNEPVFIMLGE